MQDPINSITKVRMGDGSEVVITDWSDMALYSTVDMASGFTDQVLKAFSYSTGDNVTSSNNINPPRNATRLDTNIANAAEMDASEEMLVYAISIEPFQFPADALDPSSPLVGPFTQGDPLGANGVFGLPFVSAGVLAILQQRLVISLEVSLKDFTMGGFGYFPAGFGPNIASGGPTTSIASNGLPSMSAVHMQEVPVHIGGTEKYGVNFENPTGEAVFFPNGDNDPAAIYVTARTYLRGLRKRPTA